MMNAMDQPALYIIRVRGQLDTSWADWFGGLTLAPQAAGPETLLSGRIVDQAALHGILAKLHDLNLILLSVLRVEGEQNHAGAPSPLP